MEITDLRDFCEIDDPGGKINCSLLKRREEEDWAKKNSGRIGEAVVVVGGAGKEET